MRAFRTLLTAIELLKAINMVPKHKLINKILNTRIHANLKPANYLSGLQGKTIYHKKSFSTDRYTNDVQQGFLSSLTFSTCTLTTSQPKSKKQQVNPSTDCHLLFWSSTSLNKHNREEQCIDTAIVYYLWLLMGQMKLIMLKCLSFIR